MGVPVGGTTNQILAKTSATDYATAWVDAPTGGGTSTIYNTVSKYQAVLTTGQTVWVQSSSTVNTGLSWSQATGVLTITHNGHGRSIGEMVIVRNTNVAYQYGLITAVTANTFSIACAAGTASGTSGAYSVGYTYAHNSSTPGAITSGTLTAPTNPGDLQLISLRIYLAINQRSTTTYQVIVPVGSGAGGSAGTLDDDWIPVFGVRSAVVGNLAIPGFSVGLNSAGNYTFSGLSAAATAPYFFQLQW
jgi:hypothetical protein